MNPHQCFGMLCSQSDSIAMYPSWARWMLPTCSNMPHTTFIPTTVCLVCLQRLRRARISVLGCSQSDIVVMDHFWARWTLSNLLQYDTHHFYSYHSLFGSVSRGLQRPSRGPDTPQSVFSGCSRSATPSGRCPTHSGRSLTSEIFLQDDLDPKPSEARFSPLKTVFCY